jgi:hypothetical protein
MIPARIQIKDGVVHRMNKFIMMIPERFRIKDGVVHRMNEFIASFDLQAPWVREVFTKDQLKYCRAIRKARAKNKSIRPRLIGG